MKNSLSIEEQVELLVNRGLKISDKERCKQILSRVNYYKLSGYSLHLRVNNVFNAGTSFDTIYRTYLFDKRLGAIMFDLFETVEVSLKTNLANHLGIKYGPLGYLDPTNFKNSTIHNDFVNDIYNKEKDKAYGKVKFVTHNVDKYSELPIWVTTEMLPFGPISKMYRNLRKSDQKAIVRV